jgi:hypothetical protein
MCTDAIQEIFDEDLYDNLNTIEDEEAIDFRNQLKDYVKTL